jgi:hypothetical protein
LNDLVNDVTWRGKREELAGKEVIISYVPSWTDYLDQFLEANKNLPKNTLSMALGILLYVSDVLDPLHSSNGLL